jgi:hypothetical protein
VTRILHHRYWDINFALSSFWHIGSYPFFSRIDSSSYHLRAQEWRIFLWHGLTSVSAARTWGSGSHKAQVLGHLLLLAQRAIFEYHLFSPNDSSSFHLRAQECRICLSYLYMDTASFRWAWAVDEATMLAKRRVILNNFIFDSKFLSVIFRCGYKLVHVVTIWKPFVVHVYFQRIWFGTFNASRILWLFLNEACSMWQFKISDQRFYLAFLLVRCS